jgi:hypothetical protein
VFEKSILLLGGVIQLYVLIQDCIVLEFSLLDGECGSKITATFYIWGFFLSIIGAFRITKFVIRKIRRFIKEEG